MSIVQKARVTFSGIADDHVEIEKKIIELFEQSGFRHGSTINSPATIDGGLEESRMSFMRSLSLIPLEKKV